ncbi:molybdenum ABC transporter ATP-binding protein [Agaribacterium sp. ZY112]|uniref:molybdenum ABC transporter ATP-binding protein n=1 Tax=Agaribacterium sp. ZY112 TaxID=3233574 RepID=UPI00352656F1
MSHSEQKTTQQATELKVKTQLERGAFKLNLDLSFPVGVSALFGPSGCGKTTLLRLIAGLEVNNNSQIYLGKQTWQDGKQQLPVHKRGLAYVSQHNSLLPHLNVQENLEFALKRRKQAAFSIEEISHLCGVHALLKHTSEQLSGGQKQRVMLARALLCQPSVLLLDEPFSALDKTAKHELIRCLEKVISQLHVPILYVSHSADEVMRLATGLVILKDGHVLAQGPCNDVLCDTRLYFNHNDDACCLIEGQITKHDERYHQSHVDIGGASLALHRIDKRIGDTVRLRVLARDVSLETLGSDDSNSSISNHINAEILEIVDTQPSSIKLVKLRWQQQNMLSRITNWSVDKLQLKPGMQIKAQIKSAALIL